MEPYGVDYHLLMSSSFPSSVLSKEKKWLQTTLDAGHKENVWHNGDPAKNVKVVPLSKEVTQNMSPLREVLCF